MSHSKHNTSRADFTQYERSLLKASWGSQSTRLTRDSFLPFGSCRLCLLPARAPVVACASNGDLFCRECAVSDLLAQRQEIKRLEKEWEREKSEQQEAESQRDTEAKEQELKDFEATMAGYGEKRKRSEYAGGGYNSRDKKRRATEQGIGEEKTSTKSQSFWIPGRTQSSDTATSSAKPRKLNPICPGSKLDAPHQYSLKSLIDVRFTEDEGEAQKSTSTGARGVCPACKKGLTNASKAMLTKPCGHLICKACVDKFMKPYDGPDPHALKGADTTAKIGRVLCYVCETDVTEHPAKPGKEGKEKSEKEKVRPGVVAINSEGTGFASGGANMTKRTGVAFQFG